MNVKILRKKYLGEVNQARILMAISVICGVIPIFGLMNIVADHMNGILTANGIIKNGLVIALPQLLKTIFFTLYVYVAHKNAYSVLADIRIDIINKLKKMPIGLLKKKKTGELSNIISHDVDQVELYVAHALPELTATALTTIVTVTAIFYIDYRLGLAIISTIPLVFLGMKLYQNLWKKSFMIYHQKRGRMSGDLVEYIRSVSVIKAFSNEETRTDNVLEGIENFFSWARKMIKDVAIPTSFIKMFSESGIAVMAMVGSILLMNKEITFAKLVLAIILGGFFNTAFNKLFQFQHARIMFSQTMDSIHSILGMETKGKAASSEILDAGDIEFKDVSFSYDGKNKVLEDINLTFKEGSLNAIIGASGSGKSTIANLIQGFYDVTEGSVTVGQVNLLSASEENIEKIMSSVQQETFLFNISIRENIQIGKEDATHEEIVEAAKKAQIHDVIMAFPDGYETKAGEGGSRLSGGEKQRISIARMILKNAPVIILDEAAASIDPYNEYLIQKAIDSLRQNKTVITIAHHLNTIINADQIIVMDHGKITAIGHHEMLLETSSHYRKMANAQDEVNSWTIIQEAAQ
jgi:ATP-binding cassette subfamily B protein